MWRRRNIKMFQVALGQVWLKFYNRCILSFICNADSTGKWLSTFFSWSKAVALWMLWISEFSKYKKNDWFIINVHAANEFYISEANNIISYVFLWPLKNETFLVRLYWCLYVNWAIILWNSRIDLSQLFIVHNLTTSLGCLNYFYIFLFF